MDYCSLLNSSPRENEYILCVAKHLTGWMVAVAVPDYSVETTVEAMFNEYIRRCKMSTVMLSDHRTHV